MSLRGAPRDNNLQFPTGAFRPTLGATKCLFSPNWGPNERIYAALMCAVRHTWALVRPIPWDRKAARVSPLFARCILAAALTSAVTPAPLEGRRK
jgi:hypothetical protein